ncbi:MAG: ABC transporter permease [Euryarchaeota archaeon]|nr:ABC transporter permease [Euryarchaeota archaeon]
MSHARRRRHTSTRRLGLHLAPILAVVLCWEVLARLAILNPTFFPPPSVVVGVTGQLLVDGPLLYHTWVSLRRILLAFLVGATSGIAVGLWMGWSRPVRLIVNPYVSLFYPIPKIALVPIMFTLLGVTETVRVLAMSIAVFLLVAVNTMGGVRQIDDAYIDAALDNGAGTLALYRDVLIPGSLSEIFAGLSLGLGVGFNLIVVIEMLAAKSGLGYLIWRSWRLFTIQRMYAALVMITLLGIVFIYGVDALGDRLTFWEAE